MADIEKTLLRKKAASLRQKKRRGHDLSPTELSILNQWEKTRSKRGKKAEFRVSGPDDDSESPDDVDTVVERPIQPESSEPIHEDPPTDDTVELPRQSAPPPPPRIPPTSRGDKKKRQIDEREQTCRLILNFGLAKFILPAIEKHEQYGPALGFSCPVSRADLLPVTLSDGSEELPVLYDDGLKGIDQLLPPDTTVPPGGLFALSMGMLLLSTWRLDKAIKSRGYVRPTTVDAASTDESPMPPPAENMEVADAESPAPAKPNGSHGPIMVY